MKKTALYCMIGIFSLTALFVAPCAQAQDLPVDPWAVPVQQPQVQQPQVQQPVAPAAQNGMVGGAVAVQQVGPVIYGSQPYQPTYEGGDSNPWNTKMPEFTGEMQQWHTGGKFNMPEVNLHNLLSITGHLRRMGYDIPESTEARIKAAPEKTRQLVMDALGDIQKADDPFSKSAVFIQGHFEKETGLDVENLIGNSLDLLSAK